MSSFRRRSNRRSRTGSTTYATNNLSVVRIGTDEGLVGLGLGDGGTGLSEAPRLIDATVASLSPALLGADPLDHERIWADLWVPKLVGRQGVDDAGHQHDRSRDLGSEGKDSSACRLGSNSVPTTRSCQRISPVGITSPGRESPNSWRKWNVTSGSGARAVKVKIGGLPIRDDVKRVAAIRNALGEDIQVLVDANNAYRPHEAVEAARKLESLDIFWFEEPVMPDDYRGNALVASLSPIPIASGENEYTRYGFRDLVEHGHAAILNPDAMFVGGVTEWMKVAAYAQAYDLPVAPHGNQEHPCPSCDRRAERAIRRDPTAIQTMQLPSTPSSSRSNSSMAMSARLRDRGSDRAG